MKKHVIILIVNVLILHSLFTQLKKCKLFNGTYLKLILKEISHKSISLPRLPLSYIFYSKLLRHNLLKFS